MQIAHIIGKGMSMWQTDAIHNPNWQEASGKALAHLTLSPDVFIRRGVAPHPKIPKEALIHLAKDDDVEVRWEVANNRDIPLEILLVLAGDENSRILMAVYQNQKIPQETREILRKKLKL
jgi:hypothetical protein